MLFNKKAQIIIILLQKTTTTTCPLPIRYAPLLKTKENEKRVRMKIKNKERMSPFKCCVRKKRKNLRVSKNGICLVNNS
jgi:hypothetical protein